MPEHIKDTYILMCGSGAQDIEDYLYLKYKEKSGVVHTECFRCLPGTLSEKLHRADKVKELVFDLFNVYDPKYTEYFPEVDWSDFEIDQYLEKIHEK